ncbi:glutaredoxin family protein [Xanthomonas translucens]|uniref:glutaredoxin family protein n=1 Tax=Xanthomonas campestris pv. translucens TaxID=343 RepID=UPI001E2888A6|nr:hypothetical protein [Xanthomonas translucens]MCC8447893.1 hypothetical protein [Xanthomonas translucens pv. translucens]
MAQRPVGNAGGQRSAAAHQRRRQRVLAADGCGYCGRQQADVERVQVRYRVLDVEQEQGRRAAAALGREGVPITAIGQHVIDGYRIADDRGAALDVHLLPLG